MKEEKKRAIDNLTYREDKEKMRPSLIESMTKYYDMSQMSKHYYAEKRDELVEKGALLANLIMKRRYVDALELKSQMVKEKLN